MICLKWFVNSFVNFNGYNFQLTLYILTRAKIAYRKLITFVTLVSI